MIEIIIYITGVSSGVLLCAVLRGVYIWRETRKNILVFRESTEPYPSRQKITDIMSAEDADKWEKAWGL